MQSSPPEFSFTCLLRISVNHIRQCGSHYGMLHSTGVRSETDSDSVHWREWPNYSAICELHQPLGDQLANRPCRLLIHFIVPPKNWISFGRLWSFCKISFPSTPGMKPAHPVGLCYGSSGWECSGRITFTINTASRTSLKEWQRLSSCSTCSTNYPVIGRRGS